MMELLKTPNSQNGHSPTWPLLYAQPLGTSSNVASRRHNVDKAEEVPPCDFQVILACLEYPYLFHLCGLNMDATENYQMSHWTYDFQIVKQQR